MMKDNTTAHSTPSSSGSKINRYNAILNCYKKVFLFNLLKSSEVDSEETIASKLLDLNRDCLGLDEYAKKCGGDDGTLKGPVDKKITGEEEEEEEEKGKEVSKKKKNKKKRKQTDLISKQNTIGSSGAIPVYMGEMVAHFEKTINATSGFLNFDQIFKDQSKDQSSSSVGPINLEICSGNGDWIVSQV